MHGPVLRQLLECSKIAEKAMWRPMVSPKETSVLLRNHHSMESQTRNGVCAPLANQAHFYFQTCNVVLTPGRTLLVPHGIVT